MSIETLKQDLRENMAQLATLNGLTSNEDLIKHLRETLWPTLESIVDELEEVDECVADLVSGAEDILQPETAQVFAAVIASAAVVAAALKVRIDPQADAKLMHLVTELEANLKNANEIMQEIVIDDGSDLDEEGDDGDEEEDDDDDESDDDQEGAR